MSWEQTLQDLQTGKLRSARRQHNGEWQANIAVKEEILAAFRAGKNMDFADGYQGFVDKHNLTPRQFSVADGVRMVPGGSAVRSGAYIAPSVIIMPPAYVNTGAYVDEGAMIDSHVLVGSCAQIGKHVHLSAGVQIGGVLEPIGMNPVVIEDNVFVGAGAVIVEGIVVKKHAVIAPSVVLSQGVSVYDCINKRILDKGEVIPEGAVVIPGTRPLTQAWAKAQGLQASCPIIIKYRDDKSNYALSLEETLRL